MEVESPYARWRTAIAVAIFTVMVHPAFAQVPALDPPPFSTTTPRADYQVVDAFPGLSFPLRKEDIVGLATPPGRTNELYVTSLFGKVYVITNLAAPTKTVFIDITRDI